MSVTVSLPTGCRRLIALFVLTAAFTVCHDVAYAASLRIWVMPNEAAQYDVKISQREMDAFLEDCRKSGIVIENNVRDLVRLAAPDWKAEFLYNVFYQKELIRQLSGFIREDPEIDTISVEFLRWVNAYHRFSGLAAQSGQRDPPDIIQMGSTWTAVFADQGLLEPLTEKIDLSGFYPAALSSCQIEGDSTFYAVPWFIDARLIYYQKKSFPDGPQSFESWDGFYQALSEIRSAHPFAMSLGATWNLMHNMSSWVWGANASFIERTSLPHLYHAAWNEVNFKKAVAYFHKLSMEGLFYLPQVSHEDVELDFIRGRHASVMSTSDMVRRLPKGWPTDVSITLPPAGPGGSHPFLGGSHLSVTSMSRNLPAGIRLIRHLTTPENQSSYAQATGFLPASQKAIEIYLEGRPELAVFRTALNEGFCYPSIPVWADIFENNNARTHLANLWDDIALGKPLHVVEATLADIHNNLNRRLYYHALVYYRVPMILTFSLLCALLAISVWIWRWSRHRFQSRLFELLEENRALAGQREVLEGRLTILERHSDAEKEKLLQAHQQLRVVNEQMAEVIRKKESIKSKLKIHDTISALSLNISSGGDLLIGGEAVEFDNAQQARTLIEYLLRYPESRRVHYLKGFLLFGWNDSKISSHPKRLFDTVVAKTNSALGKRGLPPILQSGTRRSGLWEFSWPAEFCERSDIFMARRYAETAAQKFSANPSSAVEDIFTSLVMDPRCLNSYLLLQDHTDKICGLGDQQKLQIRKYYTAAGEGFERVFDRYERGLLSARRFVKLQAEQQPELAEQLSSLEAEIRMKKTLVQTLLPPEEKSDTPYLHVVVDLFQTVSGMVIRMRREGVPACDIWSQVIQEDGFLSILAIPHIGKIVENFYNYSTREREDPRLVKLALILLLEDREALERLGAEKDTAQFFKTVEREIQKQFRNLESEMMSMSVV